MNLLLLMEICSVMIQFRFFIDKAHTFHLMATFIYYICT